MRVMKMGFKKILIVDDSKDMREIAKKMLKSLNYEIFEALNGKEAIVQTLFLQPDLVIMDIMMPEMDGIEATLRIKNDPKTKNIPVIMLTALSDSEAVLRSYDYGADYYLNKPFNKERLLKAIDFIKKLSDKKL